MGRPLLALLTLLVTACASSMPPVVQDTPAAPLPTAATTPPRSTPPSPPPSTNAASDPQTDSDLFDAAELAAGRGQKDRARAALTELVQKWPASRFVPMAYATLGDLSFAEGDTAHMTEAEQEYLEVVKFAPPANTSWGYAWYKLAFVYWNRGDGPRALAAFKRVIDFGAQYPQLANAAKLRTQAMRDLVPVYAQVGSPARAFPFFRMLAGDDASAIRMLDSLAQIYTTSNKLPEAQSTYRDLAVRDAPHACAYGVHARFSVAGANRAAEEAELTKCP